MSETDNGTPKTPRRTRSKSVAANDTVLQRVPKKRHGGAGPKNSTNRLTFLAAFERSYGNISYSCEVAGFSRRTYYRWMRSLSRVNVKFKADLEAIRPVERKLDRVEAALMARVEAGDTTAMIFLAKTLGRGRGYIEGANLLAQSNELETMLAGIRAMVDKKAKVNKISYMDQLKIYLELIGEQLKPEVREKLQQELRATGG